LKGKTEKISCTDRLKNGGVLSKIMEERNILHTIKRRKANWLGHILRMNCILKHVTERKVEGWIEVRRG
jgi:hypothetical protein